MPHIDITIGVGRTEEQLRAMIHRVHEAVGETVGARPEHIRIVVNEVPRTRWATGDVTLREMDDHATPAQTTPAVTMAAQAGPDSEKEEQS